MIHNESSRLTSGLFRAQFEVLEQCDFIWIQNVRKGYFSGLSVLEQCDFIWIQNKRRIHDTRVAVLEQCDFIWIQN